MKGKWTICNSFKRIGLIIGCMGIPYVVLWWFEMFFFKNLSTKRRINAPLADSFGLGLYHLFAWYFLEVLQYVVNRIIKKRDVRVSEEQAQAPSGSDAAEHTDEL